MRDGAIVILAFLFCELYNQATGKPDVTSQSRTIVSRPLAFLFRRSCLLTLVGACLSIIAIGQPANRGWEWQNPLPQGNSINCVRFAPDKLHGWAVGADGVILRTRDGGFSWEAQTARGAVARYGLFVFDRQRAFAVGARGTILFTKNGGERWSDIRTPT